ncbi:MAG: preprotein translocase subunit SecY [Candidatus Dojkabacteria bacterium]|nr:MAG: preprotein translocase subunit SecY [Candidatus Dojkabacteria bacterium]
MFIDGLQRFLTSLRSTEIRDKIFFSLLVIVVFRALAAVPVVGITADTMAQLSGIIGAGGTISAVTGGVLETASVIALGVGPYISASIILQLLGTIVPRLEELKKEGSSGRRVISMYTRYLAVPLAIMQAILIYSTLRGYGLMGELELLPLVTMIATLTAGAMLMMWIGELVTESGLGNGSSYIIFLGIVATIPGIFSANLQSADALQMVWFFLIILGMIAVVIFITEGERRLPVTYSRRVRATGNQDSYIPVKLTQFGVMPVIFASYVLALPTAIASFIVSPNRENVVSDRMVDFANQVLEWSNDPWVQVVVTFVLVILFCFFYVTIVFNTDEYAENLQKQGAFIPGIRPGAQTARYLRMVSFRLTTAGALFLAILAVLPTVLVAGGVLVAAIFTGTGLLIMVNVALDMRRQYNSLVVVRSYEKYI